MKKVKLYGKEYEMYTGDEIKSHQEWCRKNIGYTGKEYTEIIEYEDYYLLNVGKSPKITLLLSKEDVILLAVNDNYGALRIFDNYETIREDKIQDYIKSGALEILG